jgi:hypothetical protein
MLQSTHNDDALRKRLFQCRPSPATSLSGLPVSSVPHLGAAPADRLTVGYLGVSWRLFNLSWIRSYVSCYSTSIQYVCAEDDDT